MNDIFHEGVVYTKRMVSSLDKRKIHDGEMKY